jgi:Uma2 family endonuclease
MLCTWYRRPVLSLVMGIATLISEEQYLHTSYRPDCELEDGLLIERNVGEERHSWLQAMLVAYFIQRRKLWNIQAYTEQRFRIRKDRYMIPDICVIVGPRPAEQVFPQPPLIWIEILSSADRPIRVNSKVRELLDFGVPNIWIIDPETLEAEIHTPAGCRMVTEGMLRVEGTSIEVSLRELPQE